jgi:hypothetical protein
MGIFGWGLPAGCGTLPGEENMPDCCETCPEEEHENCPDYDNCLRFLKWLRRERFFTEDKIKQDMGW